MCVCVCVCVWWGWWGAWHGPPPFQEGPPAQHHRRRRCPVRRPCRGVRGPEGAAVAGGLVGEGKGVLQRIHVADVASREGRQSQCVPWHRRKANKEARAREREKERACVCARQRQRQPARARKRQRAIVSTPTPDTRFFPCSRQPRRGGMDGALARAHQHRATRVRVRVAGTEVGLERHRRGGGYVAPCVDIEAGEVDSLARGSGNEGEGLHQRVVDLIAKKGGKIYRVGMFLDLVSSSTRTPHVGPQYVQMGRAKSN